MKVYLSDRVVTKKDVMVRDIVVPLEMKWADGMIGVVPVFESKEAALQYAGGYIGMEIEDPE